METLVAEKSLSQVIRERRATPHFESAPVDAADLKKILEAGRHAPSGYNLQPWRFVVVRDAAQRKRLRPAAHNQEKVEQAPVVIVACGDSEAWRGEAREQVLHISQQHGYGNPEQARAKIDKDFAKNTNITAWLNRQVIIAFTHMMLMAEALGYDTAPMEGYEEEAVRNTLGIPASVRVVALLAIGRRRDEDKPYGGRLPLNAITFAESWGTPLEL
jgi:nitroreductase